MVDIGVGATTAAAEVIAIATVVIAAATATVAATIVTTVTREWVAATGQKIHRRTPLEQLAW